MPSNPVKSVPRIVGTSDFPLALQLNKKYQKEGRDEPAGKGVNRRGLPCFIFGKRFKPVIFCSVAPKTPSTRHLLTALEEFDHLGVRFISVQDRVDTSSPMGKAMFTIIGAMAELESSLISERVTAGMAPAKARGKHGGAATDTNTSRFPHRNPGPNDGHECASYPQRVKGKHRSRRGGRDR
jgi:hypothetical protein